MLTNNDKRIIKNISTNTSYEVSNKLFDQKFEEMTEYFDNLISNMYKQFHNEILQFKDEIFRELIPLRESFDILSGRVSEHTTELESHEKRISVLEKSQ